MNVTIPEFALVVLIGASGSGKSTFAKRHFKTTEIVSSDTCRGLVADDETSLEATPDAFKLLNFIAAKRLENKRLTVIDATSVRREDRKSLLALARKYHCLSVAIVLNLPESVSHERNATRPERNFGPHVVRNQARVLKRSVKGLKREGFRYIYTFKTQAEVDAATVERQKLWVDRRDDEGPFDIIGDVHGCTDELERLLEKLGYSHSPSDTFYPRLYQHPARRAIFLGDLVDRGPRSLDALGLVMNMVQAGAALCVPGNHDVKLLRKLRGKQVQVKHGLETTVAELEALPLNSSFIQDAIRFIDGLISHYVLDGGRLVVAHAGLTENLQGRASGAVRSFALYGDSTGETDEHGLPIRRNWAADYRAKARVVYGHTPQREAQWLNRTINIDTGCVFGGKLSALRYPEKELVEVAALHTYAESARTFLKQASLTPQQQADDILDLRDVIGKRIIETHHRRLTVRAENSAAALETMSRFAIDPKWLIYLPPTMAAPKTSQREGLLEHPDEAFEYYRSQGVSELMCQEKHMGSRALLIVCRDEAAALETFGVTDSLGVCYTRTGRPFFEDTALESELLAELRTQLDKSKFWEALETNWVLLDAELMPWSLKAQGLLQSQYAAVGAAADMALAGAHASLQQTQKRGVDADPLLAKIMTKQRAVTTYQNAYRNYCWPVTSVQDLKLAPFHVLATKGKTHTDKPHRWHMETVQKYLSPTRVVHSTAYKTLNLDEASVGAATEWWESLTANGGEGMVVKPADFVTRGKRGFVQPAVKVRGADYLSIIYGPEYRLPENLARLRARNVGKKRALALQEFVLGLEALDRFTQGEGLRRTHECVFGVLALESEPVDPRL